MPPWRLFRHFLGRPTSVTEARRFITATLGAWPVVESAELIVSELATNAVRHTASARCRPLSGMRAAQSDAPLADLKDRRRAQRSDGGRTARRRAVLTANGTLMARTPLPMIGEAAFWLVEPRGFEPLTSCLQSRRSAS